MRPRCWSREGKGDYAFLNLKAPAFDLTDRGVAGRSVAAGLDAFVYTERGVYRTGETVHLTALLRDAQGHRRHRRADDPGDRAARRRRVPPHRGAGSGHRRPLALVPDDLHGADRHLPGARLYGSEGPGGRQHELPGRRLRAGSHGVRSRLADRQALQGDAGRDHARRPLPLWRAGLQSRPRRRDEGQGGGGPARLCRLPVRRQ